MKRINLLNSDSGAMVDRRIVVKLLVTFFQRGQSPEILDLMARMLGLSGKTLNPMCKTLNLNMSRHIREIVGVQMMTRQPSAAARRASCAASSRALSV